MNTFGFIIIRHVNSEKTNKYWNHNIKLLRTFYPLTKIVIIDDNSNYEFVKHEFEYTNLEVIQSEFPRRGELLPYYYYLKNKFFPNAVIIHDSVFFHKRINFEGLNGMKVLPLWFFHSDKENIENTKKIARHLKNSYSIQEKLTGGVNMLGLNPGKWSGCFGVQSYINLKFLERIEQKYGITRLIPTINCRADRCSLERIFGVIFCSESPKLSVGKSLLGNIMNYQPWGYSFDQYTEDLKKGSIQKVVVKVWTGR
jgi:hypothetical protein